MTLPAEEFLRRFLLHVLSAGFVRIRHFGLLENRTHTAKLARCRALLTAGPSTAPAAPEPVATLIMGDVAKYDKLRESSPVTPRGPRLDAAGVLHHVRVRGLGRQALLTDDTDRADFVARLAALAEAGALTAAR
jgi:hypothetical protein